MTYRYSYRLPETPEARYISDTASIHDNVANHLAERFYRDHGVNTIVPAAEVKRPQDENGTMVMTTRYCIRRELGKCLLTPGGKSWDNGPLYLVNGTVRLRVEFDCSRCGMNLYSL